MERRYRLIDICLVMTTIFLIREGYFTNVEVSPVSVELSKANPTHGGVDVPALFIATITESPVSVRRTFSPPAL
jgi:hypothetical protein